MFDELFEKTSKLSERFDRIDERSKKYSISYTISGQREGGTLTRRDLKRVQTDGLLGGGLYVYDVDDINISKLGIGKYKISSTFVGDPEFYTEEYSEDPDAFVRGMEEHIGGYLLKGTGISISIQDFSLSPARKGMEKFPTLYVEFQIYGHALEPNDEEIEEEFIRSELLDLMEEELGIEGGVKNLKIPTSGKNMDGHIVYSVSFDISSHSKSGEVLDKDSLESAIVWRFDDPPAVEGKVINFSVETK